MIFERIMPISKICTAREVPPELKNGREMPVFGIEVVTTAIFIAACSATLKVRP